MSSLPLVASPYHTGDGERRLSELREQILLYGPCWQDAVKKLETSCSSLTENSQHRLALAFTSCFVRKMGHPGYSCTENKNIEDCADFKNLSGSTHVGSYSTFFTHAQVICSFLQQQRWQGNTLKVINALSESSTELSSQLISLNDVMALTRADQDRLQEYTQKALQENQKLTEKISSQGSSLSIMLDQIHYVNSIIAGHASTLSSFAYFLGGVLVSFLLTTPEQTRQVRSWLLLLFTANLLIELAILQWALEITGLKMSSTVRILDQRLQRIEVALSSAAARVRKTYDNIDGFRTSPMRFREVTPLGGAPRTNLNNQVFGQKEATRMTTRDEQNMYGCDEHDGDFARVEPTDQSNGIILDYRMKVASSRKRPSKKTHDADSVVRRSGQLAGKPLKGRPVAAMESTDWLAELCRDVQLEQFAPRIRDDLQITRIQHFDFVTAEDLEKIGIARPAAKRLLDAVKKCKGGWRKNLFTKILPEKSAVAGKNGKCSPINTATFKVLAMHYEYNLST
ncbi:hypothetical protein BIW11_02930 [Tropilaelaps mercedesae]|uniref:non-specific protein-tyrosine kinase n=1 Tax=Tropilaelaps mercedesae TaxID=418985 RepID=A0A1V9XUZ1_9ACAR|nr:hypothetical protein BIW11_02930 [Tropilaelaps mercedesae]